MKAGFHVKPVQNHSLSDDCGCCNITRLATVDNVNSVVHVQLLAIMNFLKQVR